jgi:hypothetical protein
MKFPSVVLRSLVILALVLLPCRVALGKGRPKPAATPAADKEGVGRQTDPGAPESPEYSRLYDELLALEAQGKSVDALRLIPRIYGTEIPVDSFYRTLEKKRGELLKSILKESFLPFGTEKYSLNDLQNIFISIYSAKPDSFQFAGPVPENLPQERFSYFMAAAGHAHGKTPSDALLEYALPAFDLKESLRSPDPWIVSTALFLGRKDDGTMFTAQDLVDRWQGRPDLWDDVCTTHALLYLAKQPPEVVRSLTIKNEDIREAVGTLKKLRPEACEAIPVFLDRRSGGKMEFDPGASIRLMPLRKEGAGATTEEKEIRLKDLQKGVFSVAPGSYRLKVVADRFYGESMEFEARPGHLLWVPVLLLPAI